jgi:probable H4MPT-linked C1 transfer pathway protein
VTRAAIDIGGANLKAAREDGSAFSIPFALWKEPVRLTEHVGACLDRLGNIDSLAVTMTGELCDCFATKSEGVRHILEAVENSIASRTTAAEVLVWTTSGELIAVDAARERPLSVAAANWLALVTWVAREYRDEQGIVVDVGSTTTDIIAFRGGDALPFGLDDTSRLASGELVYAGCRRTPVCAVVDTVKRRGARQMVAAELFATMLDVYVTLGVTPEDDDDRDTADGRPVTRGAASARLARMICVDPPDLSTHEARGIAEQIAEVFELSLAASIQRVADRANVCLERVPVSGSGESVAKRALGRLNLPYDSVTSMEASHGEAASSAACAFALARLA